MGICRFRAAERTLVALVDSLGIWGRTGEIRSDQRRDGDEDEAKRGFKGKEMGPKAS